MLFQHTAARRRLRGKFWQSCQMESVSTHSRTEAAALAQLHQSFCYKERFNTQPHGGGCQNRRKNKMTTYNVSTHSRTEAAAQNHQAIQFDLDVSTHSRTEAAAYLVCGVDNYHQFQHTAARRRLRMVATCIILFSMFQHTAARRRLLPT